MSTVFFSLIPRHPRSTLFPYTTLFRSSNSDLASSFFSFEFSASSSFSRRASETVIPAYFAFHRYKKSHRRCRTSRSEEHTSELQSHVNLVCRLLLEKKKLRQRKRRISL